MRGKVVGEDLQRAMHQGGRPIGMMARAAAGHLAAPAEDAIEVTRLRRLGRQPLRRAGDSRQSEDARPALTRALGGQIGHEPGRRRHTTGVGGEEVDDPASQRQAARTHRGRVERQAPLLIEVRPSTEVATEKHGSHIAAEPTGGSRRVQQRCSQLDFVDPRAIDGTRHRQETNSPRPAMAETLVPGAISAASARLSTF